MLKAFLSKSALWTTAVILAVGISPAAHAKPKSKAAPAGNTVAQFKASAASIPNSLIAQGYSSLGQVAVQTILQKMQTVNVVAVAKVRRGQASGDNVMERSSAQWSRESETPTIQVNEAMWPSTNPETKKVIALHENLGALGYNDDDYLMSTGMWVLTRPESAALNSADRSGLIERISAGGGVTGVGGGGDEFGATVKMRMLLSSLSRLAKATSETHEDSVHDFYADLYMRSEIRRNSGFVKDANGQYHIEDLAN